MAIEICPVIDIAVGAEEEMPNTSRLITRRELLALMSAALLSGSSLRGQEGMASRGLAPAPRPKPSGRSFGARFVDVAASAGLRAPSICGAVDHTSYLIETTGAGIAFLDYDNDGWLDIFLLSGTRMEGDAQHATNRLYKNNRDGTFTDVTEKAGLTRTGWAMGVTVGDYNNDGFEDIFVTYWGQNVLYRNNGDGTFTDTTREAGLLRPARWGTGCTFVDYDRDGFLDLFVSNYVVFDPKTVPRSCNWKGIDGELWAKGTRTGVASSVSQQREWHVHRCYRAIRHGQSGQRVTASPRWLRTSTTMAGRTSMSHAIRLRACCFATITTGRSAKKECNVASRSAKTVRNRPAWVLASATTI